MSAQAKVAVRVVPVLACVALMVLAESENWLSPLMLTVSGAVRYLPWTGMETAPERPCMMLPMV